MPRKSGRRESTQPSAAHWADRRTTRRKGGHRRSPAGHAGNRHWSQVSGRPPARVRRPCRPRSRPTSAGAHVIAATANLSSSATIPATPSKRAKLRPQRCSRVSAQNVPSPNQWPLATSTKNRSASQRSASRLMINAIDRPKAAKGTQACHRSNRAENLTGSDPLAHHPRPP